MKPFIGIKRIWYGAPIMEKPTVSALQSWLQSATEVLNSHEGTWAYTQDDPETTDYINELTGKPYYRDAVAQGNKAIAFTIGQYEFKDKVALQGGSLVMGTAEGAGTDTAIGWEAPTEPNLFYKGIVGLTKTGNLVIFTNAGIVSKTDTQEKNLGLGVNAIAMETGKPGVSDEYWLDGEKVTLSGTGASITLTEVKAG